MARRTAFILTMLLAVLLLVPAVGAQDQTFRLTMIHTNNVHGGYAPYDGARDATTDGGATRQATVIKQIRAEGGNSLLIDAGDRFTGTLFHQQWRGQDAARIMNELKYDLMAVGNHEFDDRPENLAKFIDSVKFPLISANIDFSNSLSLAGKVKPYAILEVGGEKVGFIGLTPPDTTTLSSPGKELTFSADLVGVTQKYVDELTAQGVNKIVMLTHIGLPADKEVAAKVTGIDIIVGGHSHTLLSNAYAIAEDKYPVVVENPNKEKVYIVQAGSSLKYLGRLDVQFDANGVVTVFAGDTILLSRYIAPDPDMQKIVDELRSPIKGLIGQTVGESAVFLVGDRKVCRVQECNLGNLITDAMRAETNAQIAIENGGGIRSNVPVGADTPADLALPTPLEVTMGDVLTVLPFGNLISTFELKGEDVWVALENGVSQVENGAGRFPQVSGIRYSWDGSKEAGKRIVSVEVLGADGNYTPLDLTTTYTMVSNDFMRIGGDGYSVFAEKGLNPYDFGKPLDQALAEYVQANSPIAPKIEGRITRVDAAP